MKMKMKWTRILAFGMVIVMLALTLASCGTTKVAYSSLSYSHIDTANPTYTAEKMYLENVRIAKGNWKSWLQTAGLL